MFLMVSKDICGYISKGINPCMSKRAHYTNLRLQANSISYNGEFRVASESLIYNNNKAEFTEKLTTISLIIWSL